VIGFASGSVPPCGEDFSEEAATPEFHIAQALCEKLAPAIHPREPPGTVGFAAISSRLKTSHVSTDGTLLDSRNDRNGKLRPRCAETVEDETSLWKAPEKLEEKIGVA